ncbi:hypothetical protein KP509_06G002700 [Ceratopteris richardii]|uniref:Uncharacterized protein n=1 Tax=Ceratopteris richardii TaxID=49495 RepID=A0A8T2UHL4_CERRI|nr:hypothetical protein KP509_06G002700 [Ceratopteris richardii]
MATPSDRGDNGRQTSSIAVGVTESATLEFIENVTRDAAILQKELLLAILRRNYATEYLAALGLDGSSDDYELFKRVAPPVTYEDIQPFIKRIANGDKSPILCSQPITRFFTSSGTSRGERKLIPTTEEELDRNLNFLKLATLVMRQ